MALEPNIYPNVYDASTLWLEKRFISRVHWRCFNFQCLLMFSYPMEKATAVTPEEAQLLI
jgi:hypothetical protein